MGLGTSPPSLWHAPLPLILASRSGARRALLESAGIPLDTVAADVDERALEAELVASGLSPEDRALALARAKAQDVARGRWDRLVLGADQVLALGDIVLHKPADRTVAARQLVGLSGRTHALHSAMAVVFEGRVVFEHVATARLTMRELTTSFIETYLDLAGNAALASVGGYEFERLGVHLFRSVEGDHSTILGLPLLPLLDFLRGQGSLRT